MLKRPLCIDLFCGCFGWSAGWLELGGHVVGFDIEHLPHHGPVPDGAELVLQDVLTLHGRQFKDASLILASPPCTEYSFMAMPWKRAKAIAAALRGQGEFPESYRGSRTIAELTALFDACFRIQREASEAAGRHIPLIVENVRGAQPWVGRAPWNYGSFYLWGDVPALMPSTLKAALKSVGPQNSNGELHRQSINKMRDCLKVPGLNFHDHEKGLPGRSFQSAAVEGQKVALYSDPRRNGGKGKHLTSPWENAEGVKQLGHSGRAWFADPDVAGHFSSKSNARKAASALIARIPFELSRWIARVYRPEERAA